MRAGSASYPNFLAVTLFPHSLPVAVQDLREKPDRPQNLKLCRLRLNFKALRRSCLAADMVPEGDVWYTTPRSSPSQRCCLAVSRRPGQRGSVGRRGANDGAKVFQLALPGVAPISSGSTRNSVTTRTGWQPPWKRRAFPQSRCAPVAAAAHYLSPLPRGRWRRAGTPTQLADPVPYPTSLTLCHRHPTGSQISTRLQRMAEGLEALPADQLGKNNVKKFNGVTFSIRLPSWRT